MLSESLKVKEELKLKETGQLLVVRSIMSGIRGVGPLAGRACVFIHLADCNLKCRSCNVDYSSRVENMTPAQIVQSASDIMPTRGFAVITGGEPLLQNIVPLCHLLNARNIPVHLETNGTLWQKDLTKIFISDHNALLCSPKTVSLERRLQGLVKAFIYLIGYNTHLDPRDGLPMVADLESNQYIPIARPWHDTKIYSKQFTSDMIYIIPEETTDPKQNNYNITTCLELCINHGYRMALGTNRLLKG